MTDHEFPHGFGWRPDTPDWRDHTTLGDATLELPSEMRLDLLPWMPAVYDQLRLGSCTANALAAAIEFDLRRQGKTDFMPSRLFIYYNERLREHTQDYDAGAMIRDGAKTLHRQGVCSETTWPYDVGAFAVRPSRDAYAEALATKTVSYARVARTNMQRMLAAQTPFTFGFTVYENFRDVGDDGIVQMPAGDVISAHAVLACGYATVNPRTGDPFPGGLHYRVRNSWGTDVEDAGYLWMPAHYLTNTRLASDFWAIDTVS